MGEDQINKLSACPDCGKQISVRATSCPHCGAPSSLSLDISEKRRWWLRRVGSAVFLIGELILVVYAMEWVASYEGSGAAPSLLFLLLALLSIITGTILIVKYLKTPDSAVARFALCVIAVPIGFFMIAGVFVKFTILSFLAWFIAIVLGIMLVRMK